LTIDSPVQTDMAKKKSKLQASGISGASPAEAYEATYFARKCGLTQDEALKMMREAREMTTMTTSSSRERKN
jgi:3-hydroxyisobutyrate dehydrogenase-like beta-hydroxyacid dehydrogenase